AAGGCAVPPARGRRGEPYQLSPGALLHATLVTSGTMTNRIDQLEKARLVRRRADPQDRRGVLVTLTSRGATVADAALDGLLERDPEPLTRLTPAHRPALPALP